MSTEPEAAPVSAPETETKAPPSILSEIRWWVRDIFFAVGTEDFGQVDQIGRFASQTYGGGIRYQLSPRQDLVGFASYQKRTQNRSDLASGLTYAIHF